ncbi:MAG: hypothetical protein M1835_001194 [Candelina submexicana]|nr:MAG: hypothetical protein M1835_001194 [Candelina submexicana]
MGGSVNGPYVGWISKIDRHKQLINPSIYETETSRRAKAIEKTRNMKAHRKDEREKTRILRSLQSMAVSGLIPDARSRIPELTINGLRFKPSPDGNDVGSTQSTPKKVNALDGLYIRTKNGNLYRSGLVRSKQRKLRSQKINVLCKRFTTTGTLSPPPIHTHRSHRKSRYFPVCTGSCTNGPTCRYIHDPNKVAMCKDYLSTGTCPSDGACDLSHDPTPERVPACLHFLRGNCSKSPCRYPHVRVNPGASVCRAFASLGFCEKGAQCAERHVHECPNYANTGICHEKKCRLPHIDRAGQIRKTTANMTPKDDKREASVTEEDESSDLSSEEEDHDESGSDVDSDGMEEELMQGLENTDKEDLAQQQDYIRF